METITTRTAKSELTLAAIVDTALEMAQNEGLEALSLGEVAKRLNISKSGVFSRVGSREALQQAVLDEFDRRFVDEIFKPAMALPRGLPRLNAMIRSWLRRTSNEVGCLYIAGAFEYDDIDNPMRERIKQNIMQWRGMLHRTVLQALEEGQLRPDTDPEQLVFELYCLMVGLMHDARFLREPKALERVQTAYDRLISTYRSFNYHG